MDGGAAESIDKDRNKRRIKQNGKTITGKRSDSGTE